MVNIVDPGVEEFLIEEVKSLVNKVSCKVSRDDNTREPYDLVNQDRSYRLARWCQLCETSLRKKCTRKNPRRSGTVYSTNGISTQTIVLCKLAFDQMCDTNYKNVKLCV